MEILAVAVADETAQRLAAEVRAEIARQRRTAGELARALGLAQGTVGRRLNALVPFNVPELARTATWLGVTPTELIARAQRKESVVAS